MQGEIHEHGTQVVGIGDEEVFLSIGKQLIKNTRMMDSIVKIAVTGRVPVLLVVIGTFWARKKSFLVDTRIARLIESGDANLLVGVLLDDTEGIVMGIEGRHEDEGDIDTMGSVEVLDLTDSKIEEGHVILYLEGTLGTCHA